MVRFLDGKPTGVYYSQHESGSAYEWDDPSISIRAGRVRPTLIALYKMMVRFLTKYSPACSV
jgi:hypothetical protein